MKIQIQTRTGLTTIRLDDVSAITETALAPKHGDVHMKSGTIFQCVDNIQYLLDVWESE